MTVRLALLAAVLLLSGCAFVPTEGGRALLVGDVAYATADKNGECAITSGNWDSDYGKELADVGKHKKRDRTVKGGAICFAGSGITDNLKAAIAFIAGLLL